MFAFVLGCDPDRDQFNFCIMALAVLWIGRGDDERMSEKLNLVRLDQSFSYDLSSGEVSEHALYDQTTDSR